MRPTLLTFGATALLTGCQLLGFDGHGDVDRHREIWASKQDGSYSYVLNRSCYCWPAGQFEVQVIDYKVVDAYDLSRDEPLDTTLYEYVETIEAMFDLIDNARKGHAYILEVEYSDDGYPTTITIDSDKLIADDEIYLGVSEVSIGAPD